MQLSHTFVLLMSTTAMAIPHPLEVLPSNEPSSLQEHPRHWNHRQHPPPADSLGPVEPREANPPLSDSHHSVAQAGHFSAEEHAQIEGMVKNWSIYSDMLERAEAEAHQLNHTSMAPHMHKVKVGNMTILASDPFEEPEDDDAYERYLELEDEAFRRIEEQALSRHHHAHGLTKDVSHEHKIAHDEKHSEHHDCHHHDQHHHHDGYTLHRSAPLLSHSTANGACDLCLSNLHHGPLSTWPRYTHGAFAQCKCPKPWPHAHEWRARMEVLHARVRTNSTSQQQQQEDIDVEEILQEISEGNVGSIGREATRVFIHGTTHPHEESVKAIPEDVLRETREGNVRSIADNGTVWRYGTGP